MKATTGSDQALLKGRGLKSAADFGSTYTKRKRFEKGILEYKYLFSYWGRTERENQTEQI